MSSITSLPWLSILNALRYAFILADLGLIILLVYTFRASRRLRPPLERPAPADRWVTLKGSPEFAVRWDAIRVKAESSPESATLAVIEADTLVDDVLRRLGLAGETMAERLDQLDPKEVPSLDRLWRVHRIRNAIVHRPGFSVPPSDAREMLGVYETFLKDLEVLG